MTKKGPKYLVPPSREGKSPLPQKSVDLPINISFSSIKEGKKHCLSRCQKSEIKAFLAALRKLTTMTWLQVRETGGGPNGGKVGLGYTQYPDKKLEGVSEDIIISSIRAGEKPRIYGYKIEQVFYVVAFDRNHEL